MTTQGFIALSSVTTLSVVALLVVLLNAQIELSGLTRATTHADSLYSFAYAESCAEAILGILAHNLAPPSEGRYDYSQHSCTVHAITSLSPGRYRIVTSGKAGDTTSEIQMDINLLGDRIAIDAWSSRYIPTP